MLPTDLVSPHKKPSDVWNQTVCQPSIDLETTKLTVSQILNQQLCPRFTIPTEPVINRCLPFFNISEVGSFNVGTMTMNETMRNITNGTEQLLSSLNVKDISVKIFEDFTRTWSWILIGLLLAMFLSLLFLLLLRYIAGILVWVLIVGVVAIIAYGIYHCYTEYDILKNKGATIQTIGFTTNLSAYGSVKETWLAALIVLCVAEGILLLSLLFLRNRIFIAIALIKEASRYNDEGLYQRNLFNLQIYNVVGFLWCINFVIALGQVVVLDKVTDLLLFFGKLLVVGGIGVLSFFFFTGRIPTEDTRFKSPVLNYYWLPILTVVVVEDLERNDGSEEKPYYMSKSLMKILNKKNKKPKDK
ncbi:hypothetical protein Chor_011591 [Crotalus horridus]